MKNFSSEGKALCMWLIDGLVSIMNNQDDSIVEPLPIDKKIKLIQDYIGFDKEAKDFKKSLDEESAYNSLYGNSNLDIIGLGTDEREFIEIVLCWINGSNNYLKDYNPFTEHHFSVSDLNELDYIETIYFITHKAPENDKKDWVYYKEQYIHDYKYNRNWDVDNISSPKSANEAIGALAFIKDCYNIDSFGGEDAMRAIIDICKSDFKDDIVVKRNLSKYQKYLDDKEKGDREIEEENKAQERKSRMQLLSMVLICVFAIIAIGIEVPLLHWWAALSGALTVGVAFVFGYYYTWLDD